MLIVENFRLVSTCCCCCLGMYDLYPCCSTYGLAKVHLVKLLHRSLIVSKLVVLILCKFELGLGAGHLGAVLELGVNNEVC